jgi:hypothetical protein
MIVAWYHCIADIQSTLLKVYLGFRGACPDFQPSVLLWKWKAGLSGCGTREFTLHTEAQTYSA